MSKAILHTTTRRRVNYLAPVTAALFGIWIASPPAMLAQGASETQPQVLTPVVVSGQRPSLHDVASESELVGPANQPEWTTRRAFAETDVYVIPPGEIEFNQFYISSHPHHGAPGNQFESEFEFGLPWRTQFDVEVNYQVQHGRLLYDSTMLEIPHALADWGKIPLNPTVDAGWRFNNDSADAFFFRLLLANELSQRWHFGANLTYERQISGELETAYELSAALSYVAVDSKLSIGSQLLVEYETAAEIEPDGIEHTYDTSVLLGPSVLYRPTRNTYLGLTALFGLTKDAPVAEAFLVFGIDWEPFAGGRPFTKPVRGYR